MEEEYKITGAITPHVLWGMMWEGELTNNEMLAMGALLELEDLNKGRKNNPLAHVNQSQKVIGRYAGQSAPTLETALRGLEKKGLISCKKKKGCASEYTIERATIAQLSSKYGYRGKKEPSCIEQEKYPEKDTPEENPVQPVPEIKEETPIKLNTPEVKEKVSPGYRQSLFDSLVKLESSRFEDPVIAEGDKEEIIDLALKMMALPPTVKEEEFHNYTGQLGIKGTVMDERIWMFSRKLAQAMLREKQKETIQVGR